MNKQKIFVACWIIGCSAIFCIVAQPWPQGFGSFSHDQPFLARNYPISSGSSFTWDFWTFDEPAYSNKLSSLYQYPITPQSIASIQEGVHSNAFILESGKSMFMWSNGVPNDDGVCAGFSNLGCASNSTGFAINWWFKMNGTLPQNQDVTLYYYGLNISTNDFSLPLPYVNHYFVYYSDFGGSGPRLTVNTEYETDAVYGGYQGRFDIELTNDVWFMLTFNYTRSDQTVRFYVNAEEKTMTDIGDPNGAVDLPGETYGSLRWRAGGAASSRDDLALWPSRVLTTNEITWLYNSGSGRTLSEIQSNIQ